MIQEKYFDETFRLVKNICEDNVMVCKGLPFALSNVSIQKDENESYILYGKTPFTTNLDKQISNLLRFQIVFASGVKYIILESHVVYREHESVGGIFTNYILLQIKISKIKPFNVHSTTLKYHRFIVPCKNAEKWMRDICTYGYGRKTQNNAGTRGYSVQLGVFQITILEKKYEVFPLKEAGNTFLVIDSISKCTEQEIIDTYNAVSLSLNWLLDIRSGGIAYVVGSQFNNFLDRCYLSVSNRASDIQNNYPIFTTNMYSLWDYMEKKRIKTKASGSIKNKQGEINGYLQDWLHEDELSKIVELLYKNHTLARAVYMCISASSAPLEYQPALLSVALETITTYYDTLHPDDIKTVLPKEEWRPIRKALLDTLQDLNLPCDVFDAYKRRICGDVNRKFNSQKLSDPFGFLGYNLSKLENATIDQRNNFLHGRLEDKEIEEKRIKRELPPRSLDEEYKCLITASVVLYRLCSILILKLSNFRGYIINYLLFFYPHNTKQEKMLIKL